MSRQYDYTKDPNLLYSYNEFCPDSMVDKDSKQAELETAVNNFIASGIAKGNRPPPPKDKGEFGVRGTQGQNGWRAPTSPLPNYNLTQADIQTLACSHYRECYQSRQ